ncbi:uncharacterized protein LOC124447877 isoform X2 [Xenia sp. Carnegie-2017]|uniref:uncharacterized protein LOC124447877 isoform X2 n=1 Tax=Xenia sp. Carnegie-2017 TaxID=2897299 RepID=UPI001F03F28C|nr:uncharacterized protein LOC124447877 isoform X2 [Xenia sp. Carnegie-2017]
MKAMRSERHAQAFSLCFWCVFEILAQFSWGAQGECSGLSSLVQINANWWRILPYISRSISKNGNYSYSGIFPMILERLANDTDMKVRYNRPMSTYGNFTNALTHRNLNKTIFFPVMTDKKEENKCFIPVLHTKGPVYIVHLEKIKPLELLGKGLLHGWQVIALTVVLAAISGVFMWLMDRNANPEEFPPHFFAGVWQGFWWAFVTMTTVGYGDISPRSIRGRLYCILWMIIGMIAFSILTANITSSLSQKIIDKEENLFSKKVGVLGETMDAKAAWAENARVINYYDVVSLIDALAKDEVDGILVERYAAGAHYNLFKSRGLELGKVTSFPYDIGMQLVGEKNTSMCTAFKKCIMDITKKFNIAMLKNV